MHAGDGGAVVSKEGYTMLGTILKGFTVHEGFSVKIRAGGESHYPEYLTKLAGIPVGDTLALTTAPGEMVPKSFAGTLRKKLREAYGADGFELLVVAGNGMEAVLVRKLKAALPVQPKAPAVRANGVKLGALRMENFLQSAKSGK